MEPCLFYLLVTFAVAAGVGKLILIFYRYFRRWR